MKIVLQRPPAQQAPTSAQGTQTSALAGEPAGARPIGDLDLPDDLLRERYHEVKRLITERQKMRYATPAQQSVTSCLVIKAAAMHEELLRREERRRAVRGGCIMMALSALRPGRHRAALVLLVLGLAGVAPHVTPEPPRLPVQELVQHMARRVRRETEMGRREPFVGALACALTELDATLHHLSDAPDAGDVTRNPYTGTDFTP